MLITKCAFTNSNATFLNGDGEQFNFLFFVITKK